MKGSAMPDLTIDRSTMAAYLELERAVCDRYVCLAHLLLSHLEAAGDTAGLELFEAFRNAAEERFGYEGDYRVAEIATRLPEHEQDIIRLGNALSLLVDDEDELDQPPQGHDVRGQAVARLQETVAELASIAQALRSGKAPGP
jgi:hypothetical protein